MKQTNCYLFVAFLFLGICSVNLFSDGMFMDGLFYADISRNMAEGLGSFWKPHLSYRLFNEFYEHPPLAFGLECVAFKIFGDSIYVERFYSLFTFVIVGWLMVLIWTKLTGDKRTGWLPLFFWIIVTEVSWVVANNMLENTMTIFVCLSILLYLNSLENKRFLWIILSGISLSLGLLTKGFVCLYVWTMPFFVWLFKRQNNFLQMMVDTLVFVAATIIPIAFLFGFIPDARNNMINYFETQVMKSIQTVKTVDSRFTIVIKFFKNIMMPLLFGLIVIVVAATKKVKMSLLKQNIKVAAIFFAVVLCGILPIMISMKQRGFYILSVYPVFAIGFAYLLYPVLKIAIDKVTLKYAKLLKIVTGCVIIISVGLSVSQIGRVGRDKEMVSDCKTVIDIVGKNVTINICPVMFSNWSLHGYFSRYGNVTLDQDYRNVCQYYLIFDECNMENMDAQYDEIPLVLNNYKLYRLK
ncbi:MAG: glycosyltransferase family 39 protein [Bacteroidales bacterium]|jgi:4-amino-4-deoxy-L-arabinose transferase-like glycosyltransferase|nr:glycosyltransferase family 39 protein [Bacteroidales bacterium]MDD2205030.1 glycosyltransferase family 39 protein [Bacteroidales bacterium]MDD3151500.1 glycosyltransferase family 39 protein [Bacteroidales bacterium]MDD3914507.1 glycosyltransferase family 39 protein [Bacteroidales bacterium]MDD4634393.1 glycosyltransferase family 39 protein [Bacteroidales bacterium]